MFKKIMIASAILAIIPASSFAGFYLSPNLVLETITSSSSSSRSLTPRFTAGYDTALEQNFSVAGEVFISLFGVNISDNHSGGASSIRTTRNFGASILPAVLLNENSKMYARIGVIASKFKTPGKTSSGVQIGLGLQTRLTGCWDVRGEYDYTTYRHVTGIGTPKSDTFMLGLVRNFD